MFQLRHRKFDYKDAGLDNPTAGPPFSDLITNGEEFDFNVDDIQRIRSDFKTLIKNLHPLYQIAKDDRIKAEKDHEMVVWGSESRFYMMIQELFAKLDILVCGEVLLNLNIVIIGKK